jgi:superfamily I DNA/RNA helicase
MDNKYLNKSNGIFEVRGAAGSGKTFQLTQDINYLYSKNKNIAVISFSNAAINELHSRLEKNNITISTIHSFCWKIMHPLSRRILEKIKKSPNYFIPDAFKFDSSLNFCDVKIISYGEKGIANFDKKSGNLWLSHDDVINLFIQILTNIPAFSKLISTAYDFILIDEYQDTNGEFLDALFKIMSKVCVIGIYGDPFQRIYLNKKSLNMHNAMLDYKIERILLQKNFRSQKNLVDLFNKFRYSYDQVKQEKTIPPESKPKVFVGQESLNGDLTRLISSKMNVDDAVVLSLTNLLRTKITDSSEIARMLQKGVPNIERLDWSEVLNMEQLHAHIKVLLNFSSLFWGEKYQAAQALISIFQTDSIYQTKLEVIRQSIHNQLREKNITTTNFTNLGLVFNKELLPILDWIDKFTFNQLKGINQFYTDLETLNNQSITIFSAKGLEFDNVILNIDFGWFKDRNWDNLNFEHKENDVLNINSDIMSYLFYVGITRAKHSLAIYINEKQNKLFFKNLKKKFPELTYLSI